MSREFVDAVFQHGLRFRGARIVSRDSVEIDFQGVGVPDAELTVDRTWSPQGLAVLVLGSDPISRAYSGLVHTGHTAFLNFASELLAAHEQMLPAAASYDAVHGAAGSDRRWPGGPL